MTKIRIVAAVVDTYRLTLYKEDGSTVKIPQGDERLQRIIDETKEDLLLGRVAEVEVSVEPGDAPDNTYGDFEEKSGGFVRFFRVAKNVVSSVFGGQSETDAEAEDNGEEGDVLLTLGNPDKLSTALDQIMANAKPVTDDHLEEEETVVAVVDDKPITGVEAIKDHMAYANKMGSQEGVKNFLKRIAAVIDERRHSVEDLLKFMEKGDLPIADDGSMVVYKILNRSGKPGYFRDCHTGNVPQRVGSRVCMAPEMVDTSRCNDCSNGLHVARRGYLGIFSGNTCVMAKVAPEDVIAVPHNDPRKVRVCAYTILFELTSDMYSALRRDKSMTDSKSGQKLLARALTGNHPEPIEEVRITKPRGGGVVVTPLNKDGTKKTAAASEKPAVRRATSIERKEPKTKEQAPAVSPKAVNQQVRKAKGELAPPTGTRAQIATAYMYRMKNSKFSIQVRIDAGEKLLAHRKKAKVGWARLDLPDWSDRLHQEYMKNLRTKAQAQAPKPAPKAKPAAAKKAAASKTKSTSTGSGTVADEARRLYNCNDWAGLKAFKSKKKKGWSVLGFTDLETQTILDNI